MSLGRTGETGVGVGELEADVLSLLRFSGPQTATQLAAVVGVSEHTMRVVLGLLAIRRAAAVCGHVDAGQDALRRRVIRAVWRAA
jgi:hypothetical protein